MDEQRLKDAYSLLREVFQSYKHISYDTFRHKHIDNPDIDPDIYILNHYEAGTIQGTTAFIRYPLSADGQTTFICHPCDVAVSPACRGRHISARLCLRGIEHCSTSNTSILFGTPNENSYPVYKKTLGFHELGLLEAYGGVLQPTRFFWRRVRRKLLGKAHALADFPSSAFSGPGGDWSISADCPFTEDDLTVMNIRPGIHIQRSLAFYRWKVDYLPKERRAYLCIRQEGTLRAFFVLRRNCDGAMDHCCCDICDWMLPEDEQAAQDIFQAVVRYLRPYCDLLSVCMVNPVTEASIISSGLPRSANSSQPFMIYPTAELSVEELSRLKDLQNWTLRYIDTDTILHG